MSEAQLQEMLTAVVESLKAERETRQRLQAELRGYRPVFEYRLGQVVRAMQEALDAWPTPGKVSPQMRKVLYECHGESIREMRRLWRMIEYRLKGSEPFVGEIVDAEPVTSGD